MRKSILVFVVLSSMVVTGTACKKAGKTGWRQAGNIRDKLQPVPGAANKAQNKASLEEMILSTGIPLPDSDAPGIVTPKERDAQACSAGKPDHDLKGKSGTCHEDCIAPGIEKYDGRCTQSDAYVGKVGDRLYTWSKLETELNFGVSKKDASGKPIAVTISLSVFGNVETSGAKGLVECTMKVQASETSTTTCQCFYEKVPYPQCGEFTQVQAKLKQIIGFVTSPPAPTPPPSAPSTPDPNDDSGNGPARPAPGDGGDDSNGPARPAPGDDQPAPPPPAPSSGSGG